MKKKKKFTDELNLLQTNINTFNNNINYTYLTDESKQYNINSNSWFDINKVKHKRSINLNYNNLNENKLDNVIKCKQVKLLPSNDQKEKLLLWLEYVRKMYIKIEN